MTQSTGIFQTTSHNTKGRLKRRIGLILLRRQSVLFGEGTQRTLQHGNRAVVKFGIVDLSLAPTPAVGDSVARVLEEMGLETVGTHGTTAAPETDRVPERVAHRLEGPEDAGRSGD